MSVAGTSETDIHWPLSVHKKVDAAGNGPYKEEKIREYLDISLST